MGFASKKVTQRRSLGCGGKNRLGPGETLSQGEALTGLEAERSVSEMIRLRAWNFLFPGEALTGLEAERSVSGISYSQERRSLVWRRKDPSREFLIPRRGAHWSGGGKIRLGNFLFPGEALTGLETERSVSGISLQEEAKNPAPWTQSYQNTCASECSEVEFCVLCC